MRNVAIVGATSAIAMSVARRYAEDGARLFLAARHDARLASVAADLGLRGATVAGTACVDLADPSCHRGLVAQADRALGGIDAILIAFGTLGDEDEARRDHRAMWREMTTNFLAPANLMHEAARVMSGGTIAVIGSVAGDRGRQSNYVYGAAKGGLRVFAQGLRHRLGTGPRIVLVQPGLVDTPMTSGLPKGGPLARRLWATPERVARDIRRAMDRGRPAILYTPSLWRPVMLAVRMLPDAAFGKIRL